MKFCRNYIRAAVIINASSAKTLQSHLVANNRKHTSVSQRRGWTRSVKKRSTFQMQAGIHYQFKSKVRFSMMHFNLDEFELTRKW